MNTLKKIIELENHFLNFIKNNKEVSDYILKKEWKSFESFNGEPVMDFWEMIDSLIFEKRITRVYEKDSQVPFYKIII